MANPINLINFVNLIESALTSAKLLDGYEYKTLYEKRAFFGELSKVLLDAMEKEEELLKEEEEKHGLVTVCRPPDGGSDWPETDAPKNSPEKFGIE